MTRSDHRDTPPSQLPRLPQLSGRAVIFSLYRAGSQA